MATMKEELKYVLIRPGAQYVTITGMTMMQMLFVASLDSFNEVSYLVNTKVNCIKF